jgi:methionyl-tRNA formyltransferase
MKIVFCGTPQFAVSTLEALIAAGHQIPLVVSQPDRLVGRHQQLTAPPVKQAALAHGIEVAQPEKIKNNAEFRVQLEAIAPDAIVVVAYGRIIPAWMLALPRLGCINLHASLLPKYRGAAPIQWAVAMGDAVTGNTTMLLEEGLDTGPILLQKTAPIAPTVTAADLFETLAALNAGTLKPTPQHHAQATLAPILTREDGHMDFAAHTAQQLYDRWRGFQPWPGGFALLDGKKFIAHQMLVAEPQHSPAETVPGTLVVDEKKLFVRCAAGSWLEIIELQLEGKKRMPAEDFLRGASLAAGAHLV